TMQSWKATDVRRFDCLIAQFEDLRTHIYDDPDRGMLLAYEIEQLFRLKLKAHRILCRNAAPVFLSEQKAQDQCIGVEELR
ncbi:hypothetical protein AnigIFM60653_002110, partial [Aspergillus niger]